MPNLPSLFKKRKQQIDEAVEGKPLSIVHQAQQQGVDYSATVHKEPMNAQQRAAYEAETARIGEQLEYNRFREKMGMEQNIWDEDKVRAAWDKRRK